MLKLFTLCIKNIKKKQIDIWWKKQTKKQNYYMAHNFWGTLYKNCRQWSSGFPEVVGGTAVLDEWE